jgi:hypothetical protein
MPRASIQREIGESRAQCCDCPWVWLPRHTTTNEGTQGARNAMMAATNHGRAKSHRVVFSRDTHYDYRTNA